MPPGLSQGLIFCEDALGGPSILLTRELLEGKAGV